MKKQNKETIWLVFLTVMFLLLQVLLKALPRYNLAAYKGVVAAFQYGICLLMLKNRLKIGSKLPILLMGLVLIEIIIDLFHRRPTSVPGFFNGFFYLLTLILLSHYNLQKELDTKTDVITGVYNRKGLYMELEDIISKNKEFCIIYVYVENFKAINDGYGHAYGDELLRKITKRINLRFGHECTLARLGGAEFVVIVRGNKDVKYIADRLLETISEKSILVVEGNDVDCYANCYAGISTYPKDASDAEALIKHADIAMASAMEAKYKEAKIFDVSMLEKMNRQNYVEKLIKDGLAKKLFYLVYQPQYEIDGKKLRGFETLIRMKTENGEFISPGEFIPIAEKNNLILQIDDYVLVRAMVEFKDIVAANPDLIISVNVSAKDFAAEWFVGKVAKMLKDTQFPAKNLEIEITEYCMVTSMDLTIANINQLREMGIQIALDDFGTGYTSLDYVSRLPIDLLKIDKSLIDDIENNNKRRDFVHAVINMGQLMDCEVISEGVENDSQVGYLKDYGCDMIQGFVWGKPLLYEDAKKLVLN